MKKAFIVSFVCLFNFLSVSAIANQSLEIPLKTIQIKNLIFNKTLQNSESSHELYISENGEIFINQHFLMKAELKKNGLLCSSNDLERFCYRIYLNDQNVSVLDNFGRIFFSGYILG